MFYRDKLTRPLREALGPSFKQLSEYEGRPQ